METGGLDRLQGREEGRDGRYPYQRDREETCRPASAPAEDLRGLEGDRR